MPGTIPGFGDRIVNQVESLSSWSLWSFWGGGSDKHTQKYKL